MLRGLGLDLAAAADDGHQRQMHVQHVIAAQFDAHLSDGLEKGQRFDVAHRTADLDHADVRIAGTHTHAVLDFVGDVRNDLDSRSQVIAASFFGDHSLIDSTRREIAVAAGGRAHEALVMPKIEIRLGAVRRDEHFTVLERAHGAGIDVNVRIQLHHADFESACFEDGPQRGRRNTLAERGDHTAGDENESCHDGSPPIKRIAPHEHSIRANANNAMGINGIRREFRLPDHAAGDNRLGLKT